MYMGIQEMKDADIKRGSATGDGNTVFAIGLRLNIAPLANSFNGTKPLFRSAMSRILSVYIRINPFHQNKYILTHLLF